MMTRQSQLYRKMPGGETEIAAPDKTKSRLAMTVLRQIVAKS
jgi:hypothetical protein